MVVVGLVVLVMIAVPGLVDCAVHVPSPVAVIVAEPLGSMAQVTVWSVPASGFAVTSIERVSAHPLALDQIKL